MWYLIVVCGVYMYGMSGRYMYSVVCICMCIWYVWYACMYSVYVWYVWCMCIYIYIDILLCICVLVMVTMAVMKLYNQKQLGEERVTLPHHCSSLKEIKTGIQTEQEPGGRSWCRGRGGVLLLACSPGLAQPAFL